MVDYYGRKVVIIGLGLTGLSCVNFFLEQNVIPKVIDTRISPPFLDKLPANVERHLGTINGNWLMTADLIVISPGITLTHPLLQEAIKAGIEVIGDIELFCRETRVPIVAITGSNGKSTVTMLVNEMACATHWTVSIGGNIGLPVLSLLKQQAVQFYILELSSFQLETTSSLKATAATILNVSDDHMDRYPLGIKQYRTTKLRIYENAEVCVVNADDALTMPTHSDHKYCISVGINTGDYHLNQQQEKHDCIWLCMQGEKILNTAEMKLVGLHNYTNALVALALSDTIGVPRASSIQALTTFQGLSHRFQLVHQRNGVRWINDSKATNVSSTEAALKGIQVVGTLWLLLGGDGKSADFTPLARYLQKFCGTIRIWCYGRDGAVLAALCPEISTITETLKEAMTAIASQVRSGDVVLLSPACASSDQFNNFEQRGDYFTYLAQELS